MTVQVQVQVQRKRKFNILKKGNGLFVDTMQSTMFGFDMNSGRWGPKARLQIQPIAEGAIRNNVTQVFHFEAKVQVKNKKILCYNT